MCTASAPFLIPALIHKAPLGVSACINADPEAAEKSAKAPQMKTAASKSQKPVLKLQYILPIIAQKAKINL